MSKSTISTFELFEMFPDAESADMAAAFDLPLYVDFPEWDDWLERMKDTDTETLRRRSFEMDRLVNLSRASSRRVDG